MAVGIATSTTMTVKQPLRAGARPERGACFAEDVLAAPGDRDGVRSRSVLEGGLVGVSRRGCLLRHSVWQLLQKNRRVPFPHAPIVRRE